MNRIPSAPLRLAVAVAVSWSALTPVASAQSAAPATMQTSAAGDAARGKTLWQGCAACHSIDEDDVGPRHRGVVGRRAGTLPDYNYSDPMKAYNVTWDPATLDRWLVNPSALVPGTKMFFKIDDPQSRADIIAYLEEQK